VTSIKISSIMKRFKSITALNNINLFFTPQKIHGIIGPDGAGKTTLLRLLIGLLKPNSGSITFYENETPIDFGKIRPRIAYMPQTGSLYDDLSVNEHLEIFRLLRNVNEHEFNERKLKLLNLAGLTSFINRPCGKLSGGMYKKLALICVLVHSPSILLLDEPTNGIDPISRNELWDFLFNLKNEGVLIIVTTSYLYETTNCDTIHLIDSGCLIYEGESQEFQKKDLNDLFLKHGKK